MHRIGRVTDRKDYPMRASFPAFVARIDNSKAGANPLIGCSIKIRE